MKTLKRYRQIEAAIDSFRELSADKKLPSPAHILQYVIQHENASRYEDICRHFGEESETCSPGLRDRLDLLKKVGMLKTRECGEYRVPENRTFAEGVVVIEPKGDGAVNIDAENHPAHPLTKEQVMRVVNGDRVLCLIASEKRADRGRMHILGVLNRPIQSVVGEVAVQRQRVVVRPLSNTLNRSVVIMPGPSCNAREGDIVKVALTSPPFASGPLSGKIIEVIGEAMDPNLQIAKALHQYDIPSEWPVSVLDEIKHLEEDYQSPAPAQYRKDLRELPFITIDGSDARDFDDAVYCTREPAGWRLIVAIADVSHYVQTGSALDLEACQRGTSIYFPDRVIPMLPEYLSNGICSLNPDQDRNCLICDMQINATHQIASYVFYQAVIRSKARMTYEQVEEILTPPQDDSKVKGHSLSAGIQNLKRVAEGLESNRMEEGLIAFDFPEADIKINQDGEVDSIGIKTRLRSHRIIEECMLAANRCAAEFMHEGCENQGIYRTHPGPSQENVESLRQHLRGLGVVLEGGKQPAPSDFQALLTRVMDNPKVRDAVQILLLQAMGKAIYAHRLSGHFALGFEAYTHFTSPIRRYGDLVVHRLIKKLIKVPPFLKMPSSVVSLEKTSQQCSMTERRADAAVYAVLAWLKASYMLRQIGERFSGVVTGVKDFGLFIRLDELFVDGLAHISKLGLDYYVYDENTQSLCGEVSGETFRLGDRVEVEVLDVDLSESRIRFSLLDSQWPNKFKARRRRSKFR